MEKNPKEKWVRPLLTILTREDMKESMLSICKRFVVEVGSQNANTACVRTLKFPLTGAPARVMKMIRPN